MAERGEDPAAALRRLVNGFQVSQAIHVAAVLGIADRIAAGVHDSAALAEATGTDPQALYRVLLLLASIGVFDEVSPGSFGPTPLGEIYLWGEHDRLVRPPSVAPEGWRTLLLPDCGHLPMWDDPELVVRVIRATATST